MQDTHAATAANKSLLNDGRDDRLWQQLSQFQIGDATDELRFEQRLARENGWPLHYAEQVVAEYKRFIYLIAVSGRKLTPSDAVDQAWHLHLAYTRSYWKDLCENTLGFELHHQPTRGGGQQQAHFRLCYTDTLQLYAEVFGQAPPEDIWPDVEERFNTANRFIRVNRNHVWTIAKPRYATPTLGLVSLMPMMITACTPAEGENPFWFWVKVVIGVVGIFLIIRWLNNTLGGSRSRGGDGGSGCGSGCSSGGCCGGGGD